ncbi:MAG: serine hydrolase domain-containing protein [Pseudomonadota bacterium]
MNTRKTAAMGSARSPDGFILSLFLLFLSLPLKANETAELEALLELESLPGVVWSITDNGADRSGGAGSADLHRDRPMSAQTKVQVGSVTKTLVALGVLYLVSIGELELDTSVEQLIPDLPWDNRWRNETPITVRNLLEHTAGLDNIRMWQFLNASATPDTPLTSAFPADHGYLLRVRTPPGTQYSYSNMGYAVLGLVIERVTSERYEDFLARSLLVPLKMKQSSFRFVTQQDDERLAMGYLDHGVPQPSVPMVLRPAGQFTTTASDMLSLLRFLLGSGSVDGVRLIAPDLMAKLGVPSTTDAYRAGLRIGHGLALALRDRHGVLGECHPGTTFGFRANLCVFRTQGKGFFYAVNADTETADYERLTRYFIQQMDLPLAHLDPVVEMHSEKYSGLYELAPSNMDQFAWIDWMFNSIWVSPNPQTGGLLVRSLQDDERALLPVGKGLFRDSDRRVASHVFLVEDELLLSDGLQTWKKGSPLFLLLGWISLLAGTLAFLYIIFRGTLLSLSGRLLANKPIALVWGCLVALALPVYLFTLQSFLEFGEATVASRILAALSGALPAACALACYISMKRDKTWTLDLCAVVAGLQLCVFLASQGVIPIVLWR